MGKGECCGLNFVKNVLITFNIIFLLAGFFVLAVAVWTIFDRSQYVSLLASITYPILVYFLLAAGCLVVISAFMCCYAVHKENRVLLLVYIFVLVLIFLLEAVVGVMAYIYEENVQTELKMNLNETFLTSYQVDEDRTQGIDFLQQSFRCCGAESFSDWKHSVWLQENKLIENKVPDSCCKSMTPGCGRRDHPSNIYYAGCLDRMAVHLKDHLVILSAVGLGISLIQIFGVVFAIKLYLKLRIGENDESEKFDLVSK